MNSPDCLFCRKLADLDGLPTDEVVWQFPHSVALLGPWQYYHGHCILVARTHATEFSQLALAERGAYFEEMCILARALENAFRPHKLNYELLGNQVPHLHWHLFPRYRHDPQLLRAVWLDLDRAERDPAEKKRLETGPCGRKETRDTIRARLRNSLQCSHDNVDEIDRQMS